MAKANIPSLGTEIVLNDNGLFKGAWARYMHELFARVGGGASYNLGGRFVTNTTPVGNVTGGEDILITENIPKNTIHNDGDIIEIVAFGITAANGTNKTIKLILGSTTLFSTGAVAFNNKSWCIRANIIRNGDALQFINATFNGDVALLTNTATFTSGTENFATTLAVKCTGTSGSSTTNDIIQKGLIINIFPAG